MPLNAAPMLGQMENYFEQMGDSPTTPKVPPHSPNDELLESTTTTIRKRKKIVSVKKALYL